jgi:drug/metabolite transporter (DMT)-like permease
MFTSSAWDFVGLRTIFSGQFVPSVDEMPEEPQPDPGPYAALGAVAFGWGTIPVLVDRIHLPSSLIVAGRLWLAAGCLGAASWLGGRRAGAGAAVRPPRPFSVQPWLCLGVAGLLAGHWLALFAAYRRAPAGTVILIVYLAPIGVAALAPTVLGERLSGVTVVTLGIASAGAVLITAPAARGTGVTGLVLAGLAAVLYVGLILASKPLAQIYGGLHLALVEMAGAGVVMVPVAAASHWPAPRLDWLWLLVLGVVHTAFGITVYLAVLGRLRATHVGIIGYLEPVGVVLFAWVLLSQRPSWQTVAGGLLVLGAGTALVAAEGRGRRAPATEPAAAAVAAEPTAVSGAPAAASILPGPGSFDGHHGPTPDGR